MNEHEKPQIDFMHKLARQIVERRNLVFLFVILAVSYTHLTLPTSDLV